MKFEESYLTQDFSEVTSENREEADIKLDLRFKPRQFVLSDDQVWQLHYAALEVLERTGIKVTHARALEILSGHGARVEDNRVYLPSWLVQKALALVPSSIVLGTRNGEHSIELSNEKTWFGTTLDAFDYLEPVSEDRRRFQLDDCRTTATLTNNLPNFTWNMTLGVAEDAPWQTQDRHVARQALTYSRKPLVFSCGTLESLQDIYNMGALIAGGEENLLEKPCVILLNTPISPLVYDDHLIDRLLFAAEKGLPQICYSGPQAGSTAPVTLSGTLIQGSVESLFGIVLGQLVRPGSPFVYGAFGTIFDMATTVFSFGAPEMHLMASAMAQLSHFYNLPFFGMSGCSDAKYPDSQAAVEGAFSCLTSALSGANMVHDNGLLDHATLVSPAYMVLVNEILHMVNQYMRGIVIDEERMALEVIDAVSPGGHFLAEEHTMKYFRDIWYSKLFDRSVNSNWVARGARKINDRLMEYTRQLIDQAEEPLDEAITREIEAQARHWR
ncbi:MAG: trimethylamine methyltransferase family protein [Desulfohalobiaceae bacterium]|nr:trimethylamine methyltransferase family protein [Desulfohalobiaceae bacterium]